MFEPKYVITKEILSGLIDVETARAVVDLVPVPTEWDSRLKNEAMVRKIFQSLKFNGAEISATAVTKLISYDPGRDEKASEVAEGAGIVGKESEVQLVINWVHANRYKEQITYLGSKFNQGGISEKEVGQVNALLLEKLVPFARLGLYRMSEVPTGFEARVKSIPAIEVIYQLEDFYRWYGNLKKGEIHPVILAAIAMEELIRICPFEEGNLLTALMFVAAVLDEGKFDFKDMIVWEEGLLRNREVLAMYLNTVEKNNGEMTEWVEFFVKMMAGAAAEVKTKVLMLVGSTPVFRSETGRVVPLTERQIVIMEDLTLRGETTIKEVRSILPAVSDDTILRDLKDLMEKKLIKKKGKTKGAVYKLGKIRNFRGVS